jgi:signal transduction histidine kinase
MRLDVRHKLVLLSAAIMIAGSFGFMALNLTLSRQWIEEDLKERAIMFAREIAATIGDRRELESGGLLGAQIQEIMAVRPNVLQIDMLAFAERQVRLVATSNPGRRQPFSRRDAEQVRAGAVIARLIDQGRGRFWEVMAPVTVERAIVGAVAVSFSTARADHLARRIQAGSLVLTGASVAVMALLMGVAVRLVVGRPVRRLIASIEGFREEHPVPSVPVDTRDEFGILARHFNEMMARISRFSEELRARVTDATVELDRRYQEVRHLNGLLFEMQRSLSHAERLALSGRVMAEVAHEVGTPLHSVAGHLELLRKELPASFLADDPGRRLAIIEAQVTRVIEIIARLLDVTRRSSGDPGPVDLNRLVRDLTDLVRPGGSGASFAVDVTLTRGLPPVHGHADQLQQVVLNLLTNAIDATPAGGRVQVLTLGLRDEGLVGVAVHDTGPGIPPEDHRRIFDPFFSTKPPGRGSGLGLFIAAQIVRDHKGRIEVESAPGAGSTFRVLLPAGGRTA